MKKAKKTKNKNKSENFVPNDFPRHECIVYSENLDPKYNDFKKLIESCCNRFNSKDILGSVYACTLLNHKNYQFVYGIEHSDVHNIIKSHFEDMLTRVLYKEIEFRGGLKYFPYCTFQIDHHLGMIYKIKVSSFSVKKCGDVISYFPRRQVTMKYEGRDFELCFSRHSIQRLGERVVAAEGSYMFHHMFFMYINNNLKIKKGFISNKDTNKRTVCAEIYRPLYHQLDADHRLIDLFCEWDNLKSEFDKYDYYLKVGYAPLGFDRVNGTANAKTVLIPGMLGTVENDVLTNKAGDQSDEENIYLRERYEEMKKSKDTEHWGNFFRYVCHVSGISQLVRCPKSERGFRTTYLSKVSNAIEMNESIAESKANKTGFAA